MEMPGVGPLSLDEDLGWYYSAPVTASVLGGAVGQIVITEDYPAGKDKAAVHRAVATFLSNGTALPVASADVLAYYRDTARLFREQGEELKLPEIAEPGLVWDYVSFGREFHIDRDVDGHVFVSVECECAWEPEHGLQLVLRGGGTITKVGPFDGHLTNASAYGRADLEDVVYVSPFTL
jgi:hypothetical protein